MLLKAADGTELVRAQEWLDRTLQNLEAIRKVFRLVPGLQVENWAD